MDESGKARSRGVGYFVTRTSYVVGPGRFALVFQRGWRKDETKGGCSKTATLENSVGEVQVEIEGQTNHGIQHGTENHGTSKFFSVVKH